MRMQVGMRIVFVLVLILVLVGCQQNANVVVQKQVVNPVEIIVVEDAEPSEDVIEVVEEVVVVEPEVVEEDTNTTASATHIVRIEALRLKPKEITIKVGDTIIWKNNDQFHEGGVFHLLIAYKKEFKSPRFFRGEQFEHTFTIPGTFVYTDLIFTERESMRGIVNVEE